MRTRRRANCASIKTRSEFDAMTHFSHVDMIANSLTLSMTFYYLSHLSDVCRYIPNNYHLWHMYMYSLLPIGVPMGFGIDAYATSSIAGLRPAYRPLTRSLTFSVHNGNKYSPIITGANGITRSAIVRVLSQSSGLSKTDKICGRLLE